MFGAHLMADLLTPTRFAPIDTEATSHSKERASARPGLGAANSTSQLVWAGDASADRKNLPDLTPLARLLAPGERMVLRYSVIASADPSCRITLQVQPVESSELRPTGVYDADGLSQLIATTLPGFRVVPQAAAPYACSDLSETAALRPACDLHPKDADPFVGVANIPGPFVLRPSKPSLALPLAGQLTLDVSAALSGLIAADTNFELEIAVQAITLSAADQRLLVQVEHSLRPDYAQLFDDPIGTRQALGGLDLVTAWLSQSSGWTLDCRLATLNGTPALAAVTASRLYGVPAEQDKDAAPDHALDLSLAVPGRSVLPPLIPPVAQLERFGYAGPKSLGATRRSDTDRLLLGTTSYGTPFSIGRSDLSRHIAIIGATGVGKSVLLRQMILQDIADGITPILIDPHGDLFEDVLKALSEDARATAVLADVSGRHGRFGMDLLDPGDRSPKEHGDFLADQLSVLFQNVLYTDTKEAFGPIWANYNKNCVALLTTSDPYADETQDNPSAPPRKPTLIDFQRVFSDPAFRRRCLATCTDPQVIDFWRGIASKAGGDAALENLAPYIVSKFSDVTSGACGEILSGAHPSIDIQTCIDTGRPLLVNLAKGTVGEKGARLIGALITIQLVATLLARCARPRGQRPRVRIYMDEWQVFATTSLAQLLAESRKAAAEVVLATQDLTSFGGSGYHPEIANAVLSNVGNLLCFRTGVRDAHLLSDWFAPDVTAAQLISLPDRVFAARVLDGGAPLTPQLIKTTEETDL
jgi:hypothetical protein